MGKSQEDKHKKKDQLIKEPAKMRRKAVKLQGAKVPDRNITEHTRAEEAFKESEYKYRTLVENIPDYVARFDRQYRHIFVNERTLEATQTTFEQMINKNHRDMGYPAHLCDLFEDTMDEVFKTGQPQEKIFEWGSPSGLRIIEWRAFPEFAADGNVKTILALCRDITEQKQAAEILQRANEELEMRVKERTAELSEMNKVLISEITERKKIEEELHISAVGYRKLLQEFHALFDAMPDSLVLLNLKKEIIWANKSAAHDFGMEDESGLLGHSYTKLCNKIKASSEDCPAVKSFISGKEEQSQIVTKSQKVLDIRAFPILDESGRVQSVIELSRDITSKIQAEKGAKQMQVELIRANRMTSLGTLVSGVVHEINNPNSFILSNSEVLSDIWQDAGRILKEYYMGNNIQRLGNLSFSEALEVVPELIKGIVYGSVRINNIVSNLKNFSRPATTGIWGRVSSREVIMSSKAILSSQISKYTDNFHINCDEGIPYLKGNFQQIEQVIINIILNAFQSLPHKNCGVWVSDSFDEKSGVIIIQVKDNGIGMSEDIIERITEPFFTTRLEKGGTGLGLSISYSIIREHSGALEFESSPGAGTTVTVKLPVYNPAS
ncbi:MAG: PAS domain-containing protein [Nitrospirae bacterium]|nr:PAS domain-containing protein [Nitrospirota bacterium]